MQLRRFVQCAIFFVLLIACVLAVPQSAAAATRTITETDKDSTITLHQGDELVVQLRSNPSTGYQWSVETASTTLLKLVKQTETKPSSSMLGQPIQQIFNFRAEAAGSGTLLLHYVRSWEKPSASDTEFSVKIEIQ